MNKETVKTRRRRFAALCMALVMALGLLPLEALAEDYNQYNGDLNTAQHLYPGIDRILYTSGNSAKVVYYVGETEYDKGDTASDTAHTVRTLEDVTGNDGPLCYWNAQYTGGIFKLDAVLGWYVTFDLNGHGSDAPAKQVVENNGKATEPATNPNAEAGYDTFGGWYKETGCTNPWTFGTDTVTADTTLYAKWIPNTYTVQFNGNGNTDGKAAYTQDGFTYDTAKNLTANTFARAFTVTYDYNGATGIASDMATATFGGWTASADGTGTSYTDGQSVSNLTTANNGTYDLYAKWTDGSVILPTPTMEGFTFGGWWVDSDMLNTMAGDGGASYKPTGDITLHAKWTVNNYTLTWDKNGGNALTGNYTSGSVEFGAAITAPDDPTRTGYAFNGWSPTPIAATMPAEDTTYTAAWTANNYTVKFDKNGGAGSMADQSFTYGTAQQLTANAFTRAGYGFTGWNTMKDGSGTTYANKASVENLTATDGGTVTLYAQWGEGVYNLTWDVNGGDKLTGNNYTTGSVAFGAAIVKPADPTRTGYAFAGWTPEVDETMPAEDTTYTAQWTANSYTVHFDANEGSGSMKDQSFTYGTAQDLTANAFTRADYKFTGWNTKANGSGETYTDGQSVSNLTDTADATVTLYAQWAKIGKVATPTFTPNPGVYNKAQSVTISCATDGATIYYTMDGKTPTTESTPYSDPVSVTETTTLKAIAVADGMIASDVATAAYTINYTYYTVFFNKQDGSEVTKQTVKAGELAVKPDDPTYGSFSFGGWFTDAGCTKAYDFDDAVTSDLTLYAKWGHTITVEIKNNYPDYPVFLELKRGDDVLATATITGASGSASFPGNPNGIYNLVASQTVTFTYEGGEVDSMLIKTSAVIVNGGAVSTKIVMPENDTSSVADLKVSGVVVGGLDALADKLDTWDWLKDKLAELGYSLDDARTETKMEMKESNSAALNTMANMAAQELGENANVKKLSIDVSLYITPYGSAALPAVALTGKMPVYLELIFPITDGSRYFCVFREHGANIEEIPELTGVSRRPVDANGPTVNHECWVFDGSMLYIYVNQFSDYLIGSSVTKGAPAPGPGPAPAPAPAADPVDRTMYEIKVLDSAYGRVESSRRFAREDYTITLTVKPENSQMDKLTVVDDLGRKIKLTKEKDGTYTFLMPASDVQVSAVFQLITAAADKDCPRDSTCPMSDFTDLDMQAWYHDGVHYALEHGIMNGMGNHQFAPDGTTTRAQFATILWNMEGRPAVNYTMDFSDVSESAWYAEAVRWAMSCDLFLTYNAPDGSGKLFDPEGAITREQVVTALCRYANLKGVDTSVGEKTSLQGYTDASDVSEWAVDAMRWAVGSGAVLGKTATTLNPQDTATRAEIATIMQRYCIKIAF
ncbi:MAG: hypothetical protein E7425_03475 [Ruminococcaceae bacterium]|nr:hypothetical protein [Oscillospiraceae bacterium]